MHRRVGFITGGRAEPRSWRDRLLEQFELLMDAGRSSVVVMLDTLPEPDLQLVALLAEFRTHVRSRGADCTFVALQDGTIAGLRALAPIWNLPFVQRIEDLPPVIEAG